MDYKIGVISRSREFIDLVIAMAVNKPAKVIAEQTFYYQAPEIAQEMAHRGAEVIIARERTANLLKKSLSIPVVHCNFRAIDILLSLSKAGPEAVSLALAMEEERIRGTIEILELVEKLWGQKVDLIAYSDFDALERQLKTAGARGIKGIMGGKLIVEMAGQFGLNKVELMTSQETTKLAIEEALYRAEENRRAKRKERYFLSAFQAADQALILLDAEGRMSFANPVAETVTGLKRDEFLGQPVAPFSDPAHLGPLKKGDRLRDQIFAKSRTGQSWYYSLTPLFEDATYQGCLIALYDRARESGSPKAKPIRLGEQGLTSRYSLEDIIGMSPAIQKVKNQAREFASTSLPILIFGETGTGKELFAHAIHSLSDRHRGPFVAINCAALPPSLLESELFGYESGAFTGASRSGKKGLIELAHEGTLFLDEIGEMPLDLQARLLRVLESREILRLGADRLIPVDFRVISSTNKKLPEAVGRGEFRPDLYYRLNPLVLHLPPLRERKEDLPFLMGAFLNRSPWPPHLQGEARKNLDRLSEQLADYSWPGNVRELLHLVNRCRIEGNLLRQGRISFSDLLEPGQLFSPDPAPRASSPFLRDLKTLEEEAIKAVGLQVRWNRKKMAEVLNISPATLWRKMKALHFEAGKAGMAG